MDFQTIHRFIKSNNVEFFKSAQTQFDILSLQSKCGDSLLHIACRYDCNEILESLVTVHKADIEVSNHEGKKPLHEAAQCGSKNCLNFLLTMGALIDPLKRADWTPLMLSCTKPCLSTIQALLRSGANPCLKNKDGWNSFHIACREGSIPIVEAIISNSPSVWDTKSNNLRTPLHTAALHGKCEMVSWLLKNCHYDVNATDSCGVTVLVDALRSGHVEIASNLYSQHEADASIQDKVGRQAIHHIAQAGQVKALEILLSTVNTPVDTLAHPTKETALHMAAKEGQRSVMEMLMSKGADINQTDIHGRTALHIASGAQSATCVQYLLCHGALIFPDHSGKLPNQLAVKKAVVEMFASIVK